MPVPSPGRGFCGVTFCLSEGVRLKRPQAVSLLVLTTHTSKQRNYSHPFGSFLELLCSGNSNEIEGKSNQLSLSFSEFGLPTF